MYKLNTRNTLPDKIVAIPCYDPQVDGSLKLNEKTIDFDPADVSDKEAEKVATDIRNNTFPAIGLIGYPSVHMQTSLDSNGPPTHTINGIKYRISLITDVYTPESDKYSVCGVHKD